jgi:hypothetical protein
MKAWDVDRGHIVVAMERQGELRARRQSVAVKVQNPGDPWTLRDTDRPPMTA